MRSKLLSAALVLLALGACSDGDDVTGPPAGGNFTLTVAGDGAGSGHVATAPGVEPAISCDLTGASPSGTCSASYPEGTVVDLVVTPGASVAFSGWAADAASCGTELSCSLIIDGNETATVKLGPPATGSGDVVVTSSAFYPQADFGEDGAVVWVVEVSNPTANVMESAEVVFTSKGAAGQELATGSTSIGPIPPGESRAEQSFAEYTGNEVAADFKVINVQFGSGPGNLGAAEIVASEWHIDPELATEKLIPWTVQVRNTTGSQLESVEIEFSTYDGAGKIVGASFTFVGPLAPGATESTEGLADYFGTEVSGKFKITSAGSGLTAARRHMVVARR